jgi:hypothetical protein
VNFIRLLRRDKLCGGYGGEGVCEVIDGWDEIFCEFLEGEVAGGDRFAF